MIRLHLPLVATDMTFSHRLYTSSLSSASLSISLFPFWKGWILKARSFERKVKQKQTLQLMFEKSLEVRHGVEYMSVGGLRKGVYISATKTDANNLKNGPSAKYC